MYKDAPILAFNVVVFILVIGLTNNAFRDYNTLKEILVITPPKGEATIAIDWSLDKLNNPVFKGDDGMIEKASVFGKNLADVGHYAGYKKNITVHDSRQRSSYQS